MKSVTTTKGEIQADKSAEIKESDWYVNGRHIYKADRHYERAENDMKIVVSINFSIHKDVPMVEVEDVVDVEKLAELEFPVIGIDYPRAKALREGYVRGHIAAQQKGVYGLEMQYKSLSGRWYNIDEDFTIEAVETRIKTTVDESGQLIAYFKKSM